MGGESAPSILSERHHAVTRGASSAATILGAAENPGSRVAQGSRAQVLELSSTCGSYEPPAPLVAAHLRFWASAIRARASGLRLRFLVDRLSPCASAALGAVIHFGGRPRRLPVLPLARRSRVMIASSIVSRSARSSVSIFMKSIIFFSVARERCTNQQARAGGLNRT